jgi:Phage Tail Collar Domain
MRPHRSSVIKSLLALNESQSVGPLSVSRIKAEARKVQAMPIGSFTTLVNSDKRIHHIVGDTGLLRCDGSAYEAKQMPLLYAAIETRFGEDFTTNNNGVFYVPDLRSGLNYSSQKIQALSA